MKTPREALDAAKSAAVGGTIRAYEWDNIHEYLSTLINLGVESVEELATRLDRRENERERRQCPYVCSGIPLDPDDPGPPAPYRARED